MSFRTVSGNILGSDREALAKKLLGDLRLSHFVFSVFFLDMMVILISAVTAHALKPEAHHGVSFPYMSGAVTVSLIASCLFARRDFCRAHVLFDAKRSTRLVVLQWTLLFLILIGLGNLDHYEGLSSQLWFIVFFGCGVLGLVGVRLVLAPVIRGLRDRGYISTNVAIVGSNKLATELIDHLGKSKSAVKIVGIFDNSPDNSDVPAVERSPETPGKIVVGNINSLIEISRQGKVDLAIITATRFGVVDIDCVVDRLRTHAVGVRVLPEAVGFKDFSPIRDHSANFFGIQAFRLVDHPISEFASLLKSLLDRVVGTVMLVALLPLLFFCTVGILIASPGPILFRQRRIGYKGTHFEIYKFRTMHVSEEPNTVLTKRTDPRVFGFGSLLRRTSIDELPQLFNVLKGDMSLVGPRPHMPEARAAGILYRDAVTGYDCRHRVKPGITGWAQIKGWRGPTDTLEQIERRIEHDMYYIDNWSIGLDLFILAKTLAVGFAGQNAF